MPRSPTQLPTAFEVRLKTQWESADTTEPRGMLDISKLACQAAILRLCQARSRIAEAKSRARQRVPLVFDATQYGGSLCREMAQGTGRPLPGGTDSPGGCDGALRQAVATARSHRLQRAPGSERCWSAGDPRPAPTTLRTSWSHVDGLRAIETLFAAGSLEPHGSPTLLGVPCFLMLPPGWV